MLDCYHTLTHVSYRYDPDTRQNVMVKELLHNCGWSYTTSSSVGNRQSMPADNVVAYITFDDEELDIRKGDLLILGDVPIDNMTSSKLKDKYDVMEVQTIRKYIDSRFAHGNYVRAVGV